MKLLRFIVIAILTVALFCLLYSIIPFIAYIFGGSFKEVAQFPGYAAIGGIACLIMAGRITYLTVDEEFYFKD